VLESSVISIIHIVTDFKLICFNIILFKKISLTY